MKEMSKFQLIFIGVFGLFILVGVAIFALGKIGSNQVASNLLVWGFLSEKDWNELANGPTLKQKKNINFTYVQKKEDTFDAEFVEALASGKGPDLFFLNQDSIFKHKDKILPIPYKVISERDFKDVFIQGGEIYLSKNGVLGLPFTVDPMVMYWNRTIFSNNGLVYPPKYWSDFYDLSAVVTKKDGALNINQSTVALGEFSNISHAKDIFSLLVMQAGGVLSKTQDGTITSTLSDNNGVSILPAVSALNFYTEFVNPLKPFYSWNRSLPLSKNRFIFGDLAVYFGYASEVEEIQSKNPNLNFDVAKIPQSKDAKEIITFGKMNALAVSKLSRDPNSAIQAALILISKPFITELIQLTNMPPVRKDMLSVRPDSSYMSMFYESAIQSRAWIAPDKKETEKIFKEMIESVTANRRSVSESVNRASLELGILFKN
jgi:ABC-type glycerol-3-phosphate transport system substrate-binding protein